MPYHLNWKYIQTFYFFMQQGNLKNDTLITKIFIYLLSEASLSPF